MNPPVTPMSLESQAFHVQTGADLLGRSTHFAQDIPKKPSMVVLLLYSDYVRGKQGYYETGYNDYKITIKLRQT
jgi:hypothetical protein